MDHLTNAYDPEAFRRSGHALVDILADYLADMRQSAECPANPYQPPELSLAKWERDLAESPHEDPLSLFQEVLRDSVKLHHPRYMGHQISPAAPVSVLAGMLGDLLNNGMGVYEMGVPGTAIERVVIRTVARSMGMDESADGFLTSGGSLANLTALLAARSVRAGANVWQEGDRGQLALMVSEEAHYCVDRAVRIMGWGEAGIIKVPVNDRFQMRTELLEEYYLEARKAGKEVIAVVGSACSTSTGSFDDLDAIADFCRSYDLWFHIDGAHGAALTFSSKYQKVVKGIARADSVAMDFHKMLLTPSVTTALIFRHGEDSYRTFSQKAQYLFQQAEPEWFNLARRTFECTKLMIGLKAYSVIRTHGLALFDEYVTRVNDNGALLARLVRERPDFELALEPQCNIVCFRYVLPGITDQLLDELNGRIRQHMLEAGAYYLVQTRLGDRLWLRTTLSNPFTTRVQLEGLLDTLAQTGVQLQNQGIIPSGKSQFS